MVRGIRTLLLVLMSWVMPIATLIVGGFLLSLPFTGLTVLWNTGSATTVLLLADALLILLINAAYQNGEVGESIATLVRLSARAAATLLVPLTAIAVYALSLRVGEHGWTSDRVIAATCLLVACCYALGYFAAACQRAGWLPLVAKVNVTAAFLVVAVLLALFSPIADPARISVNSQLARLDQGLVKAADFDYAYLRFQGGRYGNTALLGLKDRREGPDAALISERAKLALDQVYFGQGAILVDTDITANLKVWPATARLPATFPLRGWHSGRTALLMPKCLTQRNTSCDAFVMDLNSDGHNEVLLLATAPSEGNAVLSADAKGNWDVLGRLRFDLSKCEAFINSLKAGQFQLVAPHAKDIEIAGQRFGIDLNDQSQPGQCQELERALGGSGAGEGAANALTKTH